MIRGTITSQGKYEDRSDICEININKSGSNQLPHKKHKKSVMKLIIGNENYQAGVHEKEDGSVWISSVLKNTSSIRVRLVDALKDIELEKGSKIIIDLNNNIYTLKKA